MANSQNVWLCDAIKNGDVEFARDLLHLGADPYDKNAFRTENPLKMAVKSNNFKMVKLLLKWGYSLNLHEYHHPNTQSAFHDAVEEGKHRIVELFLQYKVDVHSVNHKNETALQIGCRMGHEEVVRLLVEAGSDIERKDSKGWSLLRLACLEVQWNIVKFLVSHGASVDTVSNGEENALLRSLRKYYSDWEIIEILSRNIKRFERCVESTVTNEIFQTEEIQFKLIVIIMDFLYSYGFKLKAYSMTLADLSLVLFQDQAIFERLMHSGCTLSISDNLEWTPLRYFAKNNKINLVRLLLAASQDFRKETWIKNEEKLMEIDNEEIRQLIVSRTSQAIPTLKHLCRFAIRDSLGYQATTKVADLGLPKSLIEYLQLKIL